MSYRPKDTSGESLAVNSLPCAICGRLTLVTALSNYGSRCLACFEAYCEQAAPRYVVGENDRARTRQALQMVRARITGAS